MTMFILFWFVVKSQLIAIRPVADVDSVGTGSSGHRGLTILGGSGWVTGQRDRPGV